MIIKTAVEPHLTIVCGWNRSTSGCCHALPTGENRTGMVALKANEAVDGTSFTERHLLCDSESHLQVDVLSAPTTTVNGTVTAILSATDNAVLDAIATDGDNIQSKLDTISANIVTCDTGSVVLAAGTSWELENVANDGEDIGDVDVTSIIPGTGATNSGKAEDSSC